MKKQQIKIDCIWRIVWQNIGLVFGVKAIVLILSAGGLTTMREAVFADVGITLLPL